MKPGVTTSSYFANRYQTDCFEDFLTTHPGYTSLSYTTGSHDGLKGSAEIECLDGKPDPTIDDIPELFDDCCEYLRWNSFEEDNWINKYK